MITVVNRKTHIPTENDFYVGRGSVLGNPYTSIKYMETKAQFKCETRTESIGKYVVYLEEKIKGKDKVICAELNRIWLAVKSGKNINLECYCTPKSCHATVIKKIIEAKL